MPSRSHTPTLKTIVVGTDFSVCAARAIAFAASLATSQGSRVHLVHVLSEPVPALDVAGALPYLDTRTRQEWEEVSRKHLEREAKALEKRGVPATSELLWGRPSDALVEAAERQKASLLVVGTHGRSAFEKFLIGSTAERVVRRASVPVLTVREKK